MGFAHGLDYNWSVVRPFVRSLREKAKYDGDVVFFTNAKLGESGFRESDREKLRQYQITEIPIDLSWVKWGQGFMMARFWQNERTIKENPQWERIILVDTRDMVFQSNLDKFFVDDDLHVQQESIYILQDPAFNTQGVLQSWGQSVLDEIGHRPVLNSGSIWGGRDALISLIQNMYSCGAKPNCDQHALMMLIHRGIIPAIQHENDGNWFWTMACTMDEHVFSDGLVSLKKNLAVPPVVHQYDRPSRDPLKQQIQDYYAQGD
jgi:hypothetical protein